MRAAGLGYHFPIVYGSDKKRVWDLRKAGLGLLSNVPGDEKPVAVIEDTAVDVADLPAYIADFNTILEKYKLYAVHYAHAATGELHLRPIINLKTAEGNQLFRDIALEIAHLVKKYQGSLSGEHGDGRLRGEFIPLMIGDHNYQLLKDIKQTWDPKGIFNPGKIVDTPSMNSFLRYEPGQENKAIKTVFRYPNQTYLQHVEQCNGSGDCRKSHLSGGTMCPSYMASKNEKDTTRARANMLREMLTHSDKANPFDQPEVKEILDLCISCKGCKSECPSSVDMAKLKAEFMQGYYDSHGVPLRSRMIGHVDSLTQLMQPIAGFYNVLVRNKFSGGLFKRMLGFAPQRQLPTIASKTLRQWYKTKDKLYSGGKEPIKSVYFFFDEFTNFNEVELGKQAILFLEKLGYQVLMIPHAFSGRALLSKGLLREARKLANKNVQIFADRLNADCKLVAVEPSTILTFRDEYVDLVDEPYIEAAARIAPHALTMEEFIWAEYQAGNISASQFTTEPKEVLLHGHCQQKAWGLLLQVSQVLAIPSNYTVKNIPSGCCGMAGSFGYEKEHYDLSMQIGGVGTLPCGKEQTARYLVSGSGLQLSTSNSGWHPTNCLTSRRNTLSSPQIRP